MKTESTAPSIVEYLDAKIAAVLSAPAAWGGLEALEPLVLMLCMCRQYAASENDDERTLMRRYRRHLAEHLGRSAAALVDRLPPDGDRLSKAVEVLRTFVASVHGNG
jgi:hypothetical protein